MSESRLHLGVPTEPEPISGERLDSWKEIARYLGRDVRTVQRWEETEGLPVYRRARSRIKGSPVYAFTAEIDAWLRRNPPAAALQESVAEPVAKTVRGKRRIVKTILSIAVLGAGCAVAWRLLKREIVSPSLRVVHLTDYAGMERNPAFSPDGKQLAFSWNGENQDYFDLYVKFIDGGKPHQLTSNPGVDGWPAWSPDGRTIAFVRWERGAPNAEFLTVEALGGEERRILELPSIPQSASYWPLLDWTPDGKWIIGAIPPQENAPASIMMISSKTLEVQSLTEPTAGSKGDCCPAIAPDGSELAFLRASADEGWNLYTVALAPNYRPLGEPRQLTDEPFGVQNPMWAANSRELFYITDREGERKLWRILSDGSHSSTSIESLGPVGYQWAISQHGDRFVYGDSRTNRDIWRTDLPDCKEVKRIDSSSTQELYPEIAPDGKRIAFISERDRGWGLWISDSDGANAIHLAPIAGKPRGPAQWAPNGNEIVFECQNSGNGDICVIPSLGGKVRRLTRNPADDLNPSWSRDGKWIYFSSNRSGSFQVWKMPVPGSESDAIKLTEGGGRFPVESPDGTTVFFSREVPSPGIWKTTTSGDDESRIGKFRVMGPRAKNFAVTGQGIYYLFSTDPERWFEIWLYRFSSGKTERISRIDNKRIRNGLSVSPDDRWLVFNAFEARGGDLYMVENFR